jgi:L-seryl-tRNA(Ser) seleniumtransferase
LNGTAAELKPRAKALLDALVKCGVKLEAALEASTSEAGSGSAPTIPLETWCVVLTRPGEAAAETARRLRLSKPAVFTRVRDGRVWIDPRTLAPGDDVRIVEAVRRAFL